MEENQIVSLILVVEQNIPKGSKRSWRRLFLEFDLYGFDNDKKALEIAEIYSWSTNSKFQLKETDSLEIGKTLFSDLSQNSKFDIILGNPLYPFFQS